MIEQQDILTQNVICNSINYSIIEGVSRVGSKDLSSKVEIKSSNFGIRKNKMGLRLSVIFNVTNEYLKCELKANIFMALRREITDEEIKEKSSRDFLVRYASDFLIKWIADLTSMSGLSPMILDPAIIRNMIK